eukprot:XP_017445636.1 PREDICTED: uncharacterized protein LOC102548730 isoform X2 [Rattus norvegicus]
MSCSHLASPLRSSGSLFPVTWHHPCGPVDHYSQSPGITPVVQWISIPREDSLQIQARSTLIPHKSAVPLYPLHLQVRIQVLRHCWQPSHLASPLRSSGSLILVIWHHPCIPVDHRTQSSGMTPAVQVITVLRTLLRTSDAFVLFPLQGTWTPSVHVC